MSDPGKSLDRYSVSDMLIQMEADRFRGRHQNAFFATGGTANNDYHDFGSRNAA